MQATQAVNSKETARPRAAQPALGWFHRYPARFHIDALRVAFGYARSRLGRQPTILLDPFSGTGATLALARQLGIPSYGVELTPLGVLIAKVRLWPPADLDAALEMAEKLAKVNITRRDHRVNPVLVTWIGAANARMLSYLIEKADEVPDPRLKRWLMLAISSSLRAASKWLVGSIKPQIDPDRTPSPLSESFARAARQLKRDCELEQHKDSPRPLTTIRRGDARNIALPDDSVDAVITSPPYEGMYDYYDVHRLTYLAFGWPQDRDGQIGRTAMIEVDGVGFKPPQPMEGWYLKEFRKEETIEGRVLRDYFDGMEKHLREIRRVVREDAALVYALADTFRRGKRYELVESIAELMKSAGFRYVSVYKRPTSNKRILPSKRNSKTGRFSSSGRVVEVEEALITARG